MSAANKPDQMLVTVDAAIFLWKDSELNILLIQRKNDPFKDAWALPGGFVDKDEALDKAAKRELKEETGMRAVNLEQFGAFGDPKRDPRGRVVSVGYLGLVSAAREKVKAADDAADAQWYSLNKLPKLAFDHKKIITEATQRLKERVIQQLDGEPSLSDDFKNHDLREILLYMYSLERK